MKHFGDITKLSGYELPIVDVITGGSPCQDLSIAGQRAGLSGERSGLFMEQIRIVKEMRKRDRANGRTGFLVRPRYMVWENVPGAFSSNKGQDFKTVLTEIIKISENEIPDLPLSDRGGWSKSGCIYDSMGKWSIAWRVHDAQFWGVPQRRKRIALVADFGGLSAPEILFERKGMSWDSAESGEKRERTPGTVKGSVDKAEPICIEPRTQDGCARIYRDGVTPTINTSQGGQRQPCVIQKTYCLQGNGIDRAETAGCNGKGWTEDVSYTLNTIDRPAVMCLNDQGGSVMGISENKTSALRAQEHGHQPIIAYGFDGHAGSDSGSTGFTVEGGHSRSRKSKTCSDTVGALCARDFKGIGNQYVEEGKLIIEKCGIRNSGSPNTKI